MRRRVLVLMTALSALLALPSAALAGTLDQAQESGPNVEFVNGIDAWAQVFTAGVTGQLDQVDLLLADFGGGPGTELRVEVWAVTSGAPASLLPGAAATVLHADVPDGPPTATWVSIPFNVPVVAGTQYAIAVWAPYTTECDADCWYWFADDAGPYAGGLSYLSLDNGVSYAVSQGRDQAFRTYVAAPAATNLPNAAMTAPSPAAPLATLGFGLLLVGSLGVLLVANARQSR
jgi:hypothetical protein